MTTADEENEVQENKITSSSRNSKFRMCCFTGIVKHVEGNMSRGQAFIFVCLNIVNSYSAPHSPVTIKAVAKVSDSEI